MDRLEIKATARTPHVIMDAKEKIFSIKGKFFPENIRDFLEPMLSWLEKYKNKPASSIEFHCTLDYLSSSAIIYMKQILQKVAELQSHGAKVVVIWNFDDDDDDIRKTGEYYMKQLNLEFKFNAN